MREPRWLSRRTLEAVHRELIQEHGGAYGVRDEGLIESALARPRNRLAYADAAVDLADLAAAYGYGLARNHGFVDGNKRAAFMGMYVFTGLNGFEIDAPEPEVVRLMEGVAGGEMSEPKLAGWIREHLAPLD